MQLVNLGLQMPPKDKLTPEALGARQQAEIAKWWPMIKAANVKVGSGCVLVSSEPRLVEVVAIGHFASCSLSLSRHSCRFKSTGQHLIYAPAVEIGNLKSPSLIFDAITHVWDFAELLKQKAGKRLIRP